MKNNQKLNKKKSGQVSQRLLSNFSSVIQTSYLIKLRFIVEHFIN